MRKAHTDRHRRTEVVRLDVAGLPLPPTHGKRADGPNPELALLRKLGY